MLLGALLSGLLSMNYFQRLHVPLSKHLSMIESRLGQPAHIKIILWCEIKFKLIAFHDSLDNPKVQACKSKWQPALLCTCKVSSAICGGSCSAHPYHSAPPRQTVPVVSTYESNRTKFIYVTHFPRLFHYAVSIEDSILPLFISLHSLISEKQL